MVRLFKRLYSLFAGNYIVLESMPYGVHARYRRLGRFRKLADAKAFAEQMSKELQGKVVVLSAHNSGKLVVYRPRSLQSA